MTVAEIQTLIAGIEAGFLEEQSWRQWTELALLEVSPVPVWLVELYDAENTDAALAALYRGWRETQNDAPLNQSELCLGFLYLRYLAGNLTLQKLLLEAGDFSDKVNFVNPSCEAFYLLLNEYEGREGSPPYESKTFSERVESLFLSFAELAKKRFSSLQRAG
ncbi:MAG: hypothetical protein IPM25_05240 [Chloracidobacterium sp.]|nr:hypothetical protein [Chloracidobacterium sp.]